MRQSVMISVIIPTHNRGTLVVEAVESVLQQQTVPLEVIVVDDGSSDDTRERLQPYLSRIRYQHQEHAGVSAARNAGIRMANGEWLAFLDSDDLWLPRKLDQQMRYLENHPHLLICQTEEIWMRRGQRLNPKRHHQKPSGHCFEALLERCLVSPSAVLLHRNLLREVGDFDESLPACEDYDLWLRIGWRHAIGLVSEPLVIKRGGHPDQLSATIPTLDLYRIRALVKLLREQPLDVNQRRQVESVLRRKCTIYSQGCLKRGRTEEAAAIQAIPGHLMAGSHDAITTTLRADASPKARLAQRRKDAEKSMRT